MKKMLARVSSRQLSRACDGVGRIGMRGDAAGRATHAQAAGPVQRPRLWKSGSGLSRQSVAAHGSRDGQERWRRAFASNVAMGQLPRPWDRRSNRTAEYDGAATWPGLAVHRASARAAAGRAATCARAVRGLVRWRACSSSRSAWRRAGRVRIADLARAVKRRGDRPCGCRPARTSGSIARGRPYD